MFRPIRVDHTNCLQVAIKTHSFNWAVLISRTRTGTADGVPILYKNLLVFEELDSPLSDASGFEIRWNSRKDTTRRVVIFKIFMGTLHAIGEGLDDFIDRPFKW
jgi:hypothetical protein